MRTIAKNEFRKEAVGNFAANYNLVSVNNDINGNPRYVIHFYAFLTDGDQEEAREKYGYDFGYLNSLKTLAVERSRRIGGKIYRGREFGGGIVFQSYNIERTIEKIKQVVNE